MPRLKAASLRVGGCRAARRLSCCQHRARHPTGERTLIVVSRAFLSDGFADFEAAVAQTIGILEGSYRLLPVEVEPLDESKLPMGLKILSRLDLTDPGRIERELERLIEALKGPLPRR